MDREIQELKIINRKLKNQIIELEESTVYRLTRQIDLLRKTVEFYKDKIKNCPHCNAGSD